MHILEVMLGVVTAHGHRLRDLMNVRLFLEFTVGGALTSLYTMT